MVDIMKWKKASSWKKVYAWMTYVIPHFRYGALIFNDIRNKHEKRTRGNKLGYMQDLLRKTYKRIMNLSKNAETSKVTQLMGNWNMKTLTLTSYIRAAKIWIKEVPENIRGREKKLQDRLTLKIQQVREHLEINERYEMDTESIK